MAIASAGLSTAVAEPLRIDGSLEGRFSDNVELSSSNETSDLETRATIGIGYRTDPGRCIADLSSRFGYGYWLDDTYDPEVYSNMTFLGDCEINDNLSWELTDYLRDVTQDTRAGDTPENRTRKNIFRTGPVLSFRPTSVDELVFRASYEQTDYSEPVEPDSERYIASAAWNHLFSPTLTAGLFAEADRAELDTVGEDVDRDTLTATFSKQWVATRLSGSLGVSQLESRRPNSESENDGIVGNLRLEREINPTTLLTLAANRELTDQTSDLDIRIGSFVFNLEQTEPVEVTAFRATLDKGFSDGSSIGLTGYGSQTDYLLSDLTDYRSGVNASYRRPVTEFMGFNAGLGYDFYDYGGETDSNDHVLDLRVGLDYQLSRKLTANGSIGHERRESETASREYDENWILLGLSYQFR
ncbi:outer membrane beta-barrel protein [Marinobacter sp.]|uniref:outer membrane beta-barrel protein n=1 Tax=Marinobacter sp. TaxID=50741 RepID=UPI00356974F0